MPPALALEGVSLRLGGFRLAPLDLTLGAGEILVVVGPNGAGKSVTLETIAGFHRPGSGHIRIGGRDATRLAPEHRRIGFVVQNFALFPQLSVAENVRFGAGAHRADSAGLLTRFGIAHLADRAPRDLSPGEKQRVALARALATRPALFLFDEPFAALDAGSREGLREDLLGFLRQAGIAAIFVTHDRSDAFVLADRIAVMHEGAMLQTGSFAEVYRHPRSRTVAAILGTENIFAGRIARNSRDLCQVAIGERTLYSCRDDASVASEGQAVAVCIRGEDVLLHTREPTAQAESAVNRLAGRVSGLTRLGPFSKVTVDCGFPLVSYVAERAVRNDGLSLGRPVTAEIDPRSIHLALPD
jgi:molybdate/tungstate transport system ATP-binding protein